MLVFICCCSSKEPWGLGHPPFPRALSGQGCSSEGFQLVLSMDLQLSLPCPSSIFGSAWCWEGSAQPLGSQHFQTPLGPGHSSGQSSRRSSPGELGKGAHVQGRHKTPLQGCSHPRLFLLFPGFNCSFHTIPCCAPWIIPTLSPAGAEAQGCLFPGDFLGTERCEVQNSCSPSMRSTGKPKPWCSGLMPHSLVFLPWHPWEAQAGKSRGFGSCAWHRQVNIAFGVFQKRVCRLLDTIPREAAAQLVDCAMDVDSRQKLLPDSAPWAAKTKQNSMILENHGSKGISQPCPRCVAGESGHFSHILGF
ncbi:uncharacterized protein C10orf143 homolog isoform X1 [Vidua chalybeata]|uniref:uncharacterized protein C10orf143 homolog isoform X1 n=1 Tax=Vidua chalybeata TaxID=81927 RepID=UPI0023A7E617|nr:uncharacterized protein C10orf143 homolog isoform X1 [Vidua chalybeata]